MMDHKDYLGENSESKHTCFCNEGNLVFSNDAYVKMFDIQGVMDDDAESVLDDLRDVFQKIAEYDLPEKLLDPYHLIRFRNKLDMAVNNECYEDAAEIKKIIEAIEGELNITDKNRLSFVKEYSQYFSLVPGLNREMIVMKDFYHGLTERKRKKGSIFPTNKIYDTGLIEINCNFLKVLALHKYKLSGENGRIIDVELERLIFDEEKISSPVIIGSLYESILYAIAIHAIRGHFLKNENGTVRFNTNIKAAQRARGGKTHSYVNTLAIWYYFLCLGERHKAPHQRLEYFMNNFPFMFDHLTQKQKQKIPMHLLALSVHQINRGMSPFLPKFYTQQTGVTREDAEAVLNFQ